RELVMFGPREVLLTSEEPAVKQFLNGSRLGPIGMSEEKDDATMAAEQAQVDAGHHDGGTDDVRGVVPQIEPTPGLPERQAVRRRKDRVMGVIHTLPAQAQESIRDSLTPEERERYGVRTGGLATLGVRRPSPRPRNQEWQPAEGTLDAEVARLPRSDWRSDGPGGGA
ncbi:MAG TPA: ABC transporter ATP-binding protein, partial [Actinophytocola sp.]|nr:ABC transporter ATP-binding protein [Actinophytocola sp.]